MTSLWILTRAGPARAKLLWTISSDGRGPGPSAMVLDWQASPSAVAFYEALGFSADRVGDFPDYPCFTLDLRTGPRCGRQTP